MKKMPRFVILVYRNKDDIPDRFYTDRSDLALAHAKTAMRKIASVRLIVIKDTEGEQGDVIIRN